MYVSSRVIVLAEFLKNKQQIKVQDVLNRLDISDRILRYDLDNLNYVLKAYNIPEITREKAGELTIPSQYNETDVLGILQALNKYTKLERMDYVKTRLLIERHVNLTLLSKEMEVSRTSIRSDLTDVIKNLDERLSVVENSIVADELVIRNVQLHEISAALLMSQNQLKTTSILNPTNDYLSSQLLDIDQVELYELFQEISAQFQNDNTNYYESIRVIVLIAYLAKINNHTIESKQTIRDQALYNVIASYVDRLNKILGVSLDKQDIIWISNQSVGILGNESSSIIVERWVDIVLIINHIIKEVSEASGYDLTQDDRLLEGLLNHIRPTIYRMLRGINNDVDIVLSESDSVKKYLDIVRDSLLKLDFIDAELITDTEVYLITLHVLAGIERMRSKTIQAKRIILVCGGGFGTSQIMNQTLKQDYNVEIVALVASQRLHDMQVKDLDAIVTTVNLNRQDYQGIPIIQVSPLMTDDDHVLLSAHFEGYRQINDQLEEKVQIIHDQLDHQTMNRSSRSLKEYLDFKAIAVVKSVPTWQKAVKMSGELLVDQGIVTYDYVDEIVEIGEQYDGHYVIGNGIVLPHGDIDASILKPSVSVVFVKEATKFPYNREGRLFFFIAAKTSKDHLHSIADVHRLSHDLNFIKGLDEIDTQESLWNHLHKFLKE
ncbi:transcription antiterminator [Erysipelothrix urinaevulpis]|uniref:BglG family transcription antiterminator n=1 Tax=Erysipelothrix urinaevulpis TaxID=2683717 RepID=UPI001358B544|nr:PTS sugar transporter subunit IIA [Erysipelothrix urinaevulpis]